MSGGFAERAAKAVADLPGPVVVDLSGLTFIDCSGVRALTTAVLAIPGWQPVTVVCRPDSVPAQVLDLLSVNLERLRAEVEYPGQAACPARVRRAAARSAAALSSHTQPDSAVAHIQGFRIPLAEQLTAFVDRSLS